MVELLFARVRIGVALLLAAPHGVDRESAREVTADEFGVNKTPVAGEKLSLEATRRAMRGVTGMFGDARFGDAALRDGDDVSPGVSMFGELLVFETDDILGERCAPMWRE